MKSNRIALLFIAAAMLAETAPLYADDAIRQVRYLDGDEDPVYQSRKLLNRVQTITAKMLPNPKKDFNCRFDIAKPDDPNPFGVRFLRGKEVRIQIPADYQAWSRDQEMVESVVAWCLLARAGLRPELESKLRGSWFVCAIARKAAGDAWRISMPMTQYYPIAYTLTAHGLTPTLQQVLQTHPAGFGTPERAFFEEYSDLILSGVTRTGMIRNGLLKQILAATLQNTNADPYDIFLDFAGPAVQKDRRSLTVAGSGDTADVSVMLEDWFQQELRRELLSYFSPVSPVLFETLYREKLAVRYLDEKHSERLCTLPDLPRNWKGISNGNDCITKLIGGLNELSAAAPVGLQEPLSALRLALAQCRTDRSEDTGKKLRDAESALFEALETRLALESYLKSAENRLVSPGMRYANSLKEVRRQQAEERRTLLPDIQRYLDEKWDDCR